MKFFLEIFGKYFKTTTMEYQVTYISNLFALNNTEYRKQKKYL